MRAEGGRTARWCAMWFVERRSQREAMGRPTCWSWGHRSAHVHVHALLMAIDIVIIRGGCLYIGGCRRSLLDIDRARDEHIYDTTCSSSHTVIRYL